jgi:methionyl-tRNA formyltransferase
LLPVPQPAEGVTYARKIAKEEARIDWHAPAVLLERRIRAFNPCPGAWFEANGERIRVLAARTEPRVRDAAPGTVLDARLAIACSEGALRPTLLQRAGKAPVAADAFLRGFPLPAGTTVT